MVEEWTGAESVCGMLDRQPEPKQEPKWVLTATNVSDFCREACMEASAEWNA